MPTTVEERLRLARPNAGGPTLEATAAARRSALAALPAHSNRRRIFAVAVTFAAAAAVVLAVELRSGAGVASAAQVRAAVSRTLASASNLRGTLVIDDPDRGEQDWSFALNSAGDLRFNGLDTSADLAYDGHTDTLQVSNGHLFTTIANFAPEPSRVSVDWMLEREVGSVITALAADEDAHVQEIQYEGRPAWLLTIRADLVGGQGTAEREIVVDRSLGLPVHDVLKNAGTVLGEWRLENLAVDTDVPPDTFALQPRPGQQTRRESLGNRRVDPKAIEAIAGYAPVVPTWLPDGYRLDHATLSPTYTVAGDLAGDNVATFVYRRGLEQLTVTMRPAETVVPSAFPGISRFCTTRSIDAIVCADTGQTLNTHDVTLEGGALSGRTAKVTIDVAMPPTLKADTPTLDVQVSGDADEAELTRIAESFVR
jgi:outer membrane lipoprotein-sorting protein